VNWDFKLQLTFYLHIFFCRKREFAEKAQNAAGLTETNRSSLLSDNTHSFFTNESFLIPFSNNNDIRWEKRRFLIPFGRTNDIRWEKGDFSFPSVVLMTSVGKKEISHSLRSH